MKSFTEKAQAVWGVPTLTEKKILLMNMVNDFQYQDKQDQFRRKVNAIKSIREADKLAGDLALRGEGLQVL